MKRRSPKISILLTFIATAIWFIGSWWHYSCNIKNTCGSHQSIASNETSRTIDNNSSSNTPETVIDTDSDGLSDIAETRLGTNPLLQDTDEDSIPDNEEIGINLNSPLDTDKDSIIDALDFDDDNDGVSTLIENKTGTSALHADTDNDGVFDAIEIGKNPNKTVDTDSDGIINALDTDDDDDGLETSSEILLGTNYLLVDTDGDGLSDAKEIGELLDKPIDSDSDGIIDALDTVDDSDTDNDGLTNAQETRLGSKSTEIDSDNDGVNDNQELGKNIDDPLDTDNDGILNIIDKDDDNDQLSTRYEIRIGTNPLSNDSDGDGLKDNIEAKNQDSDTLQDTDNDGIINPVDADDDNDKIDTIIELSLGTNPLKPDSDDDGISDAIEIANNIQSFLDSGDNDIMDALNTTNENQILEKPTIAAEKSEKISKESEVNTPTETLNIELLRKHKGRSIQTAILYFPFFSDKPVINTKVSRYFEKVVNWMKKNPRNNISLTGHTDNTGASQANLALGIRRVMVIRELLIEQGAPIGQIDIFSQGESQPLEDNATEHGRLKNRRVEITPM